MSDTAKVLILAAIVFVIIVATQVFGAEKQPKLRVVAFTATWCGPCRHAHEVLNSLAKRGLEVQYIDIDEHRDLAEKYHITSIPTMYVIRGDRYFITQNPDDVAKAFNEGNYGN